MLTNFDPKNLYLMPHFTLEVSKAQITKLGLTLKVGHAIQFVQFFHLESTKIEEKLYYDSIWMTPLHLQRLFLPQNLLMNEVRNLFL